MNLKYRKAKYLVLKYYCKIKIKRGIAMKFVKIDKEKFKPTKNSVKELIFLAYLSFILFICTEVMSAMGTTSYGYIENILSGLLFHSASVSWEYGIKRRNQESSEMIERSDEHFS